MTLILHFWLRATSIRCYARLLSPLNRSQVCVCMCVCVLVRFKSEPNVQIFRLGDQIFRIGKLISTFGFLVRTSSFPEIIRNTHPGKDRERDSFVLENVWFTKWFTKAKSFEPDQKITSVQDRKHCFSTLELILEKQSFLRIHVRNTCLCIYELGRFQLMFPEIRIGHCGNQTLGHKGMAFNWTILKVPTGGISVM